MKSNRLNVIISAALAALVLGAGTLPPAAATPPAAITPPAEAAPAAGQGPAAVANKEEVVYARLGAGGEAEHAYVVNRFEVTQPGLLRDYGEYSELVNLSTLEPLAQNGAKVEVAAPAGSFFYQGTLENPALPWLFAISYSLDGQAIAPEALAGKSGRLEIRLHIQKNEAVQDVFYENYMLQISLTLDGLLCRNIASPGATIANAGKNKLLTHTLMPGAGGDITVTADAENFTMGGIEIAGMPFSMEIALPGTDELTGEMTTLTDAIAALNDGVAKLDTGAGELNKGVAALADGSADFAGGLALLGGSAAVLVDGSSQINSALAAASAGLSGGGAAMDIGALAELPDTLAAMATGLNAMAGGLAQAGQGFAAGYAALDAAIAAIPALDATATDALLAEANTNLSEASRAAFYQILGAAQAAQVVKGTYYGPSGTGGDGAKAAFEGVLAAITALTDPAAAPPAASVVTIAAGLDSMAAGLRAALQSMDMSQLEQLADGMAQLAAQYGAFHSGLVQYTSGVAAAQSGYAQLHEGLVSLEGGAGQLAKGTARLHKGSSELNDGVADLPDSIQLEIDAIMDEYTAADFTPVSFVSPQNRGVSLVQFVFITEGIALPEQNAPQAEADAPPESLWDRFAALFGPGL